MISPKTTANFPLLKPLTVAISSCILVACSSTGTTPAKSAPAKTVVTSKPASPPTTSTTTADSQLDPATLSLLEDLLEASDVTMVEGDELAVQRYGNLWERIRRGYRIPETTNARIEAQKSWFYTRQSYLDRLTARASRYLHHTVAEAERRGIPSELALLPIIESSYDPSATSNAAAAGLWQFIPSTGRIYGLNQSDSYDGRRDVIESTRAAYDFLTSLYNQFGSWELALAAYNAGPGRISKAIKANQAEGLPTDYWSLRLPTETMNYVPRFLAVSQIVSSPETYGVYLPAIANHSHFRTVPVNYGVSLSEVSSVTGVSFDELRLLNPALLNHTVDAAGPNRIVIPDSVPNSLDANLSALAGYGYGGDYVATAPAQSVDYVLPKSGAGSNQNSQQELIRSNTLPTTIAQVTPNNTIIQEPALSTEERDFIAAQIQAQSAERVQAVNPQDGNIQLEAVQTGQSVLDARGENKSISFANSAPQAPVKPQLPPAQNHTKPAEQATPVKASTPKTTKPAPKPESYTVKAGDSLTSVAAANGLTVGQLASYNNLASDAHILIGQRLWLVAGKVKPTAQPAKPANTPAPTKTTTNPNTHTVQAGENLTVIARKYNVSLPALASENNLSTTDGVQIGQTLKLPSQAGQSAQAKPAVSTAKVEKVEVAKNVPKPESYTVKAGDSLTSVAAANGLTVGQLASYNNLASDAHILIGQRLWLVAGKVKPTAQPAKPANTPAPTKTTTNPNTHTVQAGENLTVIARKYNVSLPALASENNLSTTDGVQIGQTLKLPSQAGQSAQAKPAVSTAKVERVEAAKPTKGNTRNIATENYTVKAGDSLTALANRAGVSLTELASLNGLPANASLRVGQGIKLPKLTTSYTVKAGDGLISLARRYGISVEELAKMNHLEPSANLRIGQVLTVPNR
ncbi:LysM peptidoglycan-binding domain-containing protein [Moraxella nasicaprae]|uniref:LysM peptidoglycan-binding domain-containing protein n=1 Tax=Moraxella nasicaprae TaxID=2904122 RepID=A0ABY6F4R1_9GAMM|nr:LysM peptidoglycan-binding domain-containing protein [Moraxella nasicaprae]UXZ05029.1 LysM peptidoglycan-binding domain-containing protein [Moraxella nasicaprae]